LSSEPPSTLARALRWPHALWQEAGRGTVVGLLLAALLTALLGSDHRIQRALRWALFDVYQQQFVRERVNDSVVVVAIDDASIAALGQWPWPRQQVAALIDALARQQVAVIGLDIVFAEPDRRSPQRVVSELIADGQLPRDTPTTHLQDSDAALARSMATVPVVLGVGGLASDAGLVPGNDYRPRFREVGGSAAPFLPSFAASLRSIPLLDEAAVGHGVFNSSHRSSIVREVPTLVRIGDTLQPGFALEMLRIAHGAEQIDVRVDTRGIAEVAVADTLIPTLPNGEWLLHFSRWQERPQFSAAQVLRGELPPGTLAGRMALVGYTALGLQDNIRTPLGTMAGVQVHAEAIDNLLDHRLLSRPRWAGAAEASLLATLSLLVIVLVPLLPSTVTAVVVALVMAAVSLLGLQAFLRAGLLIDTINPVLQALLVYAVLLAFALSASRAQRQRLRDALALSREQQARIAGELDAARRIQLGMLPDVDAVLGNEPRLALAAHMQSARTVGGDLYDFFRLDDHRLFFVVGDVSGKGLPASLFMALAKALTHAAAQSADGDPARTLIEAAAAMDRENPEFLFVTLLAGVIDLDTGRVSWCNAGHEPPYHISAAGPQRLSGESGPPLCVLEGYVYVNNTLQLQPGELLCLVTDGITEAHDATEALYGLERLGDCLTQAMQAAPQALIEAVEKDVARFAAGVEQSDDLTIMALRWCGPATGPAAAS